MHLEKRKEFHFWGDLLDLEQGLRKVSVRFCSFLYKKDKPGREYLVQYIHTWQYAERLFSIVVAKRHPRTNSF